MNTTSSEPVHAPVPSGSSLWRRLFGWMLVLVSIAWLGTVGWQMVLQMPADLLENHRSKSVQERMRRCEGTFRERYACKETILVSGGRAGFTVWLDRLLFTFVPPATVWAVWVAVRRREE